MWKRLRKTLSHSELAMLGLSAFGAMAMTYILFFSSSTSHLEKEMYIGELNSESTVRRRHSQSLVWFDIKNGASIFQKDIVYVPTGVGASISFGEGKRVTLDPESMVQFDDVARERLQIILFSGRAKGDLIEAPKPVSRIRWFSRLRLRTHPQVQLPRLLDYDSLLLLVSEWEQRVDVQLKQPKKILGKVKSPKPLIPYKRRLEDYSIALVGPQTKNQMLVTNRWLPFEWTALPEDKVRFELDVASSADFKQYLTYKTEKNKLSVQFDDAGEYHWRVRATRGRETLFSDNAKFTVKRPGSKNQAIALRLPTSVSRGGQFAIEIARDEEFKDLVKTIVLADPKCPKSDLAPGKYFCRVNPVDPAGGNRPKTYSFSVP